MARETIDFGIDLGTTNSAIAMMSGSDVTVIRNNLQREYTPSAVYVNKQGRIYVGERARDRVESDPANACAEFKLRMGVRGQHKLFEAAGRAMTPEELSAEVLKSMRGDVQRSIGEDIGAAVITVPAAFDLDQCDATRRAAALAGFEFAPLIQEPTAATWAYSTTTRTERGFWLVYDFGGGTFDAAVINVRDGEFTVVNHAGDNFLGGKLIDWGLVDTVLVPAVRDGCGLTDLARDNPKWVGNIAKLKMAAENAKIELSQNDGADIELELEDGGGGKIDFEYTLTRSDVERVARPLYARSIELCRSALAEKSLRSGDIERVLLVGGATLAPALRELLADPDEGLGIPIDHSQDPVTVVARGAAVFASTQRMPARSRITGDERIRLEMKQPPVGQELEPLAGGRVSAPDGRDWTGGTIEFVNSQARPEWRSGLIPLTADGAFTTRLRAEEGKANAYTVELRDRFGTVLPTEPSVTSYRHTSITGGDPVLSHSIGVGLEDNGVEWLLRKGTALPANKRVILRSSVDVRRNDRAGLIRVPILEGEKSRADRNTLIGQLDIRPDEVRRDVPAGSEVEVVLHIDRSFKPRAEVYVPLLDEEFEIVVELGRSEAPDAADLHGLVEQLAARATTLREEASDVDAQSALAVIDRFHADGGLTEIRGLATAVRTDPDAAQALVIRIRAAQSTLDDAEDALLIPQLDTEARTVVEAVLSMAEESGTARDREELANVRAAIQSAINSGDRVVLQRQINVARQIGLRVLHSTGQWELVQFGLREDELAEHPDQRVRRLLAEGRAAIAAGDSRRLAQVNAGLSQFMPDDVPAADILSKASTVLGDH